MKKNAFETNKEETLKKATFAGGCFWCMEPAFKILSGVIKVIPGYTGGFKENPSYEEVSMGTTGHLEAVQVTYDSKKTSYEKLLDVFWKSIDPTDDKGQFADSGSPYKTAIFYHDENQKKIAESSKKKLQESGIFDKPVVTKIIKATKVYPAEKYHWEYYKKHPVTYNAYKYLSGREKFLERVWKKNGKIRDNNS